MTRRGGESRSESRSRLAERFEEEIRGFLKTLGFKHVKGGRSFTLGGVQVDAAGGYGSTYVIVDCHTSVENRRRGVRQKIKMIRGDLNRFRRGIREGRRLARYARVKLVLCTRRIDLSKADRQFARKTPRVYLWDDSFVDHYKKLGRKIGSYALFSVLNELGLRPTFEGKARLLRIPAFRVSLRGRTLYNFWCPPEILLRLGYVARREIGKEQFYQRLLKADRIASAAKYISDGKRQSLFPNSIILNFTRRPSFNVKKSWSRSPRISYGTLNFPNDYRSAWVIDGQHRLYAFSQARKARKELLLPVVGFSGLREEEQAEFFLVINREQKAVNPNLLWDLESQVHPWSPSGIIANTVKRLDQRGSLKGLVYYPLLGARGKGRPFKLANFCDAIEGRRLEQPQTEHMTPRMKNPLYDRRKTKRLQKLSRGINNLFASVAETFEEDWSLRKKGFFCTDGGASVMIRVFERILCTGERNLSRSRIRDFLAPLREYYDTAYQEGDLPALRKLASSEGGRDQVALEFCYEIGKMRPKLLEGLRVPKTWPERFAEFEEKFTKYFLSLTEKDRDTWWEGEVPLRIRRRAEERVLKRDVEPWHRLTLGEWKDILVSESFWSSRMPGSIKTTLSSQARLQTRLEELLEYRNIVQHGGALTDYQSDAADFFMKEFGKLMR